MVDGSSGAPKGATPTAHRGAREASSIPGKKARSKVTQRWNEGSTSTRVGRGSLVGVTIVLLILLLNGAAFMMVKQAYRNRTIPARSESHDYDASVELDDESVVPAAVPDEHVLVSAPVADGARASVARVATLEVAADGDANEIKAKKKGPKKSLKKGAAKARAGPPDFNVEQNVCPGKPSGRGVGRGRPANNIDLVSLILDNLGEGKVIANMSENVNYKEMKSIPFETVECPFLTRDCAFSGPGREAQRAFGYNDDEWMALSETFPDVKPGGLGSCALVGNSDVMLQRRHGQDIDDHDSVFRHNTPLKPQWEKHIGTKSTVVWIKAHFVKKYEKYRTSDASLAYVVQGVTSEQMKRDRFLYKGKPILLATRAGKVFRKTKRLLYKYAGYNNLSPSGGYSRPFLIIGSGLCTRVDLYGFSSRPKSGKYFARNKKVSPTHKIQFEHWSYRYLMKQGKVCVYGE